VRQVVLVARNGLVERLAKSIAAEVEALAPAVLVQVRRQIVVVPGKCCVLVAPRLSSLAGAAPSGGLLTLRVSSVSSPADLLSQCLKYSSTAACWAALSFCSMADMPPRVPADLPCMALLNSASRV
jgi:hypothetical protein